MHAGIANERFPLKSVVGKTFPALPAHAQPATIRIWQETHFQEKISMSFFDSGSHPTEEFQYDGS